MPGEDSDILVKLTADITQFRSQFKQAQNIVDQLKGTVNGVNIFQDLTTSLDNLSKRLGAVAAAEKAHLEALTNLRSITITTTNAAVDGNGKVTQSIERTTKARQTDTQAAKEQSVAVAELVKQAEVLRSILPQLQEAYPRRLTFSTLFGNDADAAIAKARQLMTEMKALNNIIESNGKFYQVQLAGGRRGEPGFNIQKGEAPSPLQANAEGSIFVGGVMLDEISKPDYQKALSAIASGERQKTEIVKAEAERRTNVEQTEEQGSLASLTESVASTSNAERKKTEAVQTESKKRVQAKQEESDATKRLAAEVNAQLRSSRTSGVEERYNRQALQQLIQQYGLYGASQMGGGAFDQYLQSQLQSGLKLPTSIVPQNLQDMIRTTGEVQASIERLDSAAYQSEVDAQAKITQAKQAADSKQISDAEAANRKVIEDDNAITEKRLQNVSKYVRAEEEATNKRLASENARIQRLNQAFDSENPLRDEVRSWQNLSKFYGGRANVESMIPGARDRMDELNEMGYTFHQPVSAWEQIVSHVGRHVIQIGTLIGMYQVAFATIKGISQAWSTMVQETSEFQVQSALFKNYQEAFNISPNAPGQAKVQDTTADLLSSAISLSVRYGDNINDVAQDLSLWKKSLGDLNSAIFMTNEGLKFQLATGTQLEDFYTTLSGLAVQAPKIRLTPESNTGFTLSQTPQLMNMITAAALAMGPALHTATRGGVEMGTQVGNAAELIIKAMDKDSAAMGSFGLSLKDIIAINAGLIQAFGGTTSASSEAADKLSRVFGALNSASAKASVAKQFQDLGITVSTTGDLMENLQKRWDTMTDAEKHHLMALAGNQRQFEAINVIMESAEARRRAYIEETKNMSAEDKLAADMSNTYAVQVQQLSALMGAFAVIIGDEVLPQLQSMMRWVGNVSMALVEMGLEWKDNAAVFGITAQQGGLDLAEGQISGIGDPATLAKAQQQIAAQRDKLNSEYAKHQEHAYLLEYIYAHPEQAKNYMQDIKFKTGGPHPQTYTEKIPDDVRQYASTVWAWYQATHNGSFATTLTADQKKALDAAGQALKTPLKGVGDIGMPGATAASEPSQFRAQIELNTGKMDNLIAWRQREVEVTDEQIRKEEELARTYGLSDSTLAQLFHTTQSKVHADDAEIEALKAKEKYLTGKSNEAYQKATKAGLGSKEGIAYISQWHELQNELRALERQITTLDDASDQAGAHLSEFYEKAFDQRVTSYLSGVSNDLSTDQSTFSHAKTYDNKAGALADVQATLSDLNAYYTSASQAEQYSQTQIDILGKISAKIQEVQKAADGMTEDLKNMEDEAVRAMSKSVDAAGANIQKDAIAMSGLRPQDAKYLEDLATDQRKINDLTLTYNENLKKVPSSQKGLVDAWYETNIASVQADETLQDYQRKLDELKNSPGIQALQKAFSDLASGASSSITGSLFGTSAQSEKVFNLQDETSHIEQWRQTYEQMWSEQKYHTAQETADHNLRMNQMQEEIRLLKMREQAAKDALEHPPFLKKVAQDFTKTFFDNLFKQFMDNLVNSTLAEIAGGGKNNTNEVLQRSMHLYSTTTQSLSTILQDYYATPTNDLITALGGTPGSIIPMLDMAGSSNLGLSGGAYGLAGGLGGGYGAVASLLGGGGGGGGFFSALVPSIAGGVLSAAPTLGLAGAGMLSGGNLGGEAIGGLLGAGAAGLAVSEYIGAGVAGTGAGLGILASSPYGLAILAALTLFGAGVGGHLFGPHTNPQQNPDMYANTGFAQEVANANGTAYTQATGNVSEDPSLSQSLGGQSQLQYIDAWVKQHPNGQGLTAQEQQLWQQANQMTAGGSAVVEAGLYQGQMGLFTSTQAAYVPNNRGSGSIPGTYMNWNDLNTKIDSLTQNIYQLNSTLNQNNQALVALNQYGSGIGFLPYSWNTPGYEFPPGSTGTGAGAPSSGSSTNGGSTPPGSSTSGTNGGTTPPHGTYRVSGGDSGYYTPPGSDIGGITTNAVAYRPVQSSPTPTVISGPIQVSTNLDGRAVARSVQSYTLRAHASGVQRVM